MYAPVALSARRAARSRRKRRRSSCGRRAHNTARERSPSPLPPATDCDRAEREENTIFPHVLVSTGTATLIITGRAPRQLPLRALSTKQKHPIAAATMPAYRAVSSPLPSARTARDDRDAGRRLRG